MRKLKMIGAATAMALMSMTAGIPAFAAADSSGMAEIFPVPAPAIIVHPLQAEEWIVAQVTDPRVMAMEEQVRSLSGQVEELNFLLLQLQEQLRKMQEDNEFRFQQLEGAAPARQDNRSEVPVEAPGEFAANGSGAAETGEPPRNLGAIILNSDGSVKDVTLGEPMDLRGGVAEPGLEMQAPASPATDETTVAALPETANPEELYGNSYEFILSGDYATAEAGFRRHVEQFPADPRTADARYWLGEALLSQGRHAEAAEIFLAASRDFPDSRKAPEMLLKLGIALTAIDQKEVACATFRQVEARYPDVSSALRDRVRQEAALTGC